MVWLELCNVFICKADRNDWALRPLLCLWFVYKFTICSSHTNTTVHVSDVQYANRWRYLSIRSYAIIRIRFHFCLTPFTMALNKYWFHFCHHSHKIAVEPIIFNSERKKQNYVSRTKRLVVILSVSRPTQYYKQLWLSHPSLAIASTVKREPIVITRLHEIELEIGTAIYKQYETTREIFARALTHTHTAIAQFVRTLARYDLEYY